MPFMVYRGVVSILRNRTSSLAAPIDRFSLRALACALSIGLVTSLGVATPALATTETTTVEPDDQSQAAGDAPEGDEDPAQAGESASPGEASPPNDPAPASDGTDETFQSEPESSGDAGIDNATPFTQERAQFAGTGSAISPLVAVDAIDNSACKVLPNSYLSVRQVDRGGVAEGEATTALDLHSIDPTYANGAMPFGKINPNANATAGWPIKVDTPTSKPPHGSWGDINFWEALGSNALGVSDDGFAYFTYQYEADDRSIGTPYEADFVDVWRVNLNVAPNSSGSVQRVAQHVLFGTEKKPAMSAGGVNPVDGKYYFASLFMNSDNTLVEVKIFRFNPDTGQVENGSVNKYQVRAPLFQAQIAPSVLGWGSASNTTRNAALSASDLAFGPDGTMYLLVQNTSSPARTRIVSVSPEQLLLQGTPGTTTQLTTELVGEPFATSDLEGFTLTNTAAVTLVRNLNEHTLRRTPWSGFSPFSSHHFGNNSGEHGVRDLASCSTRVYLSMDLDLSAPRVKNSDQFTVEVTATGYINGAHGPRPTSAASGTSTDALAESSPQSVFRGADGRPAAVGLVQGDTVHVKTTLAETADLGSYSVHHSCYNTAIPSQGKPGKLIYSGGDGSFTVPQAVDGNSTTNKQSAGITPRIVCESEIQAPAITVAKSAKMRVDGAFSDFTSHTNPATDRVVYAGSELEYSIAFGNEQGTHLGNVDYVDWMHDLCDDVRTEDQHAWLGRVCSSTDPIEISPSDVSRPTGWKVIAENGSLRISGAIPAGANPGDYTLKYRVTTLNNGDNADTRGARPDAAGDAEGYVIRNYVTPYADGASAPTSCAPSGEPLGPATAACTEHPIAAWTVEKSSQPRDGAWLHNGGNVYYRVTASKVGDLKAALTGLTLTDDISEVFAVARLDVGAPTFGGEYQTGIRYFDENGDVVREVDATQNLSAAFAPEWQGGSITDPTDPSFESKWSLGITPIDLRENEVRAEITYAVKVGGYASPTNPHEFAQAADGSTIAPQAYARFTNTIAGSAAQPLGAPNQCEAGSLDLVTDPACQVDHQLADNYFHVQKNSSSSRPGSQVWNIGGEFVLGDGPTPSADSEANTWSRNICRVDNYVDAATGAQAAAVGSQVGNTGVQPGDVAVDGGPLSGLQILNSIKAWNDAHPEAPKQLCGLFYQHLVDSDSNAGTWHAEEIPAGEYLLYDTVAAPGHQALAEPVAFAVAPVSANVGGSTLADSLSGLGKLSIYLDAPLSASQVRPPAGKVWDNNAIAQWQLSGTSPVQNVMPTCDWLGSPASPPSDGSAACVMATGWLLQVYEPKQQTLPFTGSSWRWATVFGPALLGGLLVAVWWRRRNIARIQQEPKF